MRREKHTGAGCATAKNQRLTKSIVMKSIVRKRVVYAGVSSDKGIVERIK